MTILQSVVYGIVQGLGEFLPISSSAHLILVPWFLHWPDPGLTFDVALHIGTLCAVLSFFWRDWLRLIKEGFSRGLSTTWGWLFWFLVAASIPGAIAGALLEQKAETTFRSPLIIGITMMTMGVVLWIADQWSGKKESVEQITFGQSLIIGLSQALAVIPGVSRSGITISSGLFTGLSREEAARFSFLLSTPIIAGAGFLKLRHLTASSLNAPFLIGVATSALVGFLVIGVLLKWLRKSSYLPFVWYRILMGIAVTGLYFIRVF